MLIFVQTFWKAKTLKVDSRVDDPAVFKCYRGAFFLQKQSIQISFSLNPSKTDKTAANGNLGQCLKCKPQEKFH